eukprot:m.420241 g.420241  ORF g.420241 m.420241 type:complete len:434 (-) comp21315_c0_seq7:689-1990(-)
MRLAPMIGTLYLLLGVYLHCEHANGAIIDFISAYHFEDLIRDTPRHVRTPVLLAFTNISNTACKKDFDALKYNEHGLPPRNKLLLGKYDMQAQYTKTWFKFTDEMDMPKRFGITRCPTLVLIPPEYTGRRGENENDALNHLTWNGTGDWRQWVMSSIGTMTQPKYDLSWTVNLLEQRDYQETVTHRRISTIPARLPMYTKTGYKKIPMPDGLYEELQAWYHKHEHLRAEEDWSKIATQLNTHEAKMTMVSFDHDAITRDRISNTYVRPILSNWSGIAEDSMALKAVYGIREYYRGNELRTHVDTIATHVLSAILNINQVGMDEPWPLEVINHDGVRELITMEPKEMVLYESATLPHGRPFPLKGEKFSNMFVHYQPKGWDFVEDSDGMPYSTVVDRERISVFESYAIAVVAMLVGCAWLQLIPRDHGISLVHI